jgi:hypothetical protein
MMMLVCMTAACHRHNSHNVPSASDMPQVQLSIPDDVPDEIVLRDKDGTTHVANGKQLYEQSFRFGWEQFWQRYQSGDITIDDKHAKADVIMAVYGLQQRGIKDGFDACRRAVLSTRHQHAD